MWWFVRGGGRALFRIPWSRACLQPPISPSPHSSTTPLIIWLQGGPGASSLTGAFYELGRYITDERAGTLHTNPATWTKDAGVLFIEQPIGVGFSTVGGRRRPATSAEAAVDVVAGLDGFFRAHPDLAARPLILAGESYAGRYVPEIAALATSLANDGPRSDPVLPKGPLSFSLRGIAIGNGLVDPESQAATIAPYLAERGLINDTAVAIAANYTRELSKAVAHKKWSEAHAAREAAVAFLETTALGVNGTLLDDRRKAGYDANNTVRRLMRRQDVRAALHVDDQSPKWVRKAPEVARALHDDKAVSSAPLVQCLLEGGMPVLLYYGIEDAKDGAYSSAPWISRLSWRGRPAYDAASVDDLPRQPDGDPGGIFKSGGGLTVAEVYDAGHMAPRDSGIPVREFISAWIDDTVVSGQTSVDIGAPAPAVAAPAAG